jgi:hypothetical protein
MAVSPHPWPGLEEITPLPFVIKPATPEEAQRMFLERWNALN